MVYNLRHNADIVHLAQGAANTLDATALQIYFAKIYGDTEFLNSLVYPNINQKVKRPNIYGNHEWWVSEISAEHGRVLVRTTEDIDDPNYDDSWVSVKELKFVKKDVKPVRKTFDNTLYHNSTSHQHLSNIIWFNKLIWSDESPLERIEIDQRFNGEVLPYRPSVEFPEEIHFLKNCGYITDDNKIIFNDEIIGEVVTKHDH